MLIGIDLGTSNCAVSIWQDGQSVLVPNVYGKNLTPSVVGIDDDGHMLVGAPAHARLFTHPELTLASFKRFMGTDHSFRLGNQHFRAEELSALLLRSLKADVEQHCGCKCDRAIITVPAYFNDVQRNAVRAAGELAGLHVERCLTSRPPHRWLTEWQISRNINFWCLTWAAALLMSRSSICLKA